MQSSSNILKVSEFTKKVRFMLESEFNTVWLCGEISNFIPASSGHWYLSLKDNKSQVRCAMFKGSNRRVRIIPKNGQQVLIRAKVSLYEPRGDFQLIIEQMEDAGEGLLRQKLEQLKQQLNEQGLFSLQYKKILPKKIKNIGVVTSPTGAAIQDIIAVLKRRNPFINIIIYPCLVQGKLATDSICEAINIANTHKECDVLIVGRGGGSIEDLWSFNEEKVVRAVFNSELPTISAVGHEIDTTLVDYTADLRAATPSAAAELVSTEIEQLVIRVQSLTRQLERCFQQIVLKHKQQLKHLQHRLSMMHPEHQLQVQQQNVDHIQQRLKQAFFQLYQSYQHKLPLLKQRLNTQSPIYLYEKNLVIIKQLEQRLNKQTENIVQQKKVEFSGLIEKLQIVSPLATIARGYSIVRNEKDEIIKRKEQLKIGDSISIQISDGKVQAKVDK